MLQTELKFITKQIVHAATIAEEIQSAKLLSTFFSQLNLTSKETSTKNTETTLSGGIALSFTDAAICVDDYLRTARFIKSVYFSMEELLSKFPFKKSSILYAGCGPYATLLLPLLPLFAEDDFDITLLDISETSILSVQILVDKFNLKNYHIKTTCGNAITYKHKQNEEKPLRLIITETMFNALVREPQVAITANLAPQLAEGGILIPEEIIITAGCSFFAHEPFLKSTSEDFFLVKKPSIKYASQHKLDTLFSMNKVNNFSDKVSYNNHQFESAFYELPKEFTNYPDVCIYTDITIFKNIKLTLAESYITNPYCVSSLLNFTNCTHFKLIYNFKEIPKWTYELK